jgi:hypothetical protein
VRTWLVRAVPAALLLASACVVRSDLKKETFRIKVDVQIFDPKTNAVSPLPDEKDGLCLDLRGDNPKCPEGTTFLVDLTAIDSSGAVDTTFNGYARITTRPGTVVSVEGDRANGRNVLLKNGVATGQQVHLVGTYGPTRIEAADEGYNPVDTASGKVPGCADGVDNDGDGLTDYPADPGCAAPNDDTEQAGSAAAGVSPTIWYQYPDIPAVRGLGPATPFEEESVVVETRPERGANLIVTRVSSSGMFVTDLAVDANGKYTPKDFGSLYIFNFSVPPGVRVCDRLSYLSGTMSEFHGWAEMGFPSYGVVPWFPPEAGGTTPCLVPEPIELTAKGMWPVASKNNAQIQKVESSLVRVRGGRIGKHFGGQFPTHDPMAFAANPANSPCALTASNQIDFSPSQYTFSDDASSCDFNHSGNTDFDNDVEETNCLCWCTLDAECSPYDAYQQRGGFRLIVDTVPPTGDPANTILANTDSIATFDPHAYRGQTIPSITGTLAHFSGGDLNWTIEARCTDDLIICPIGDAGCLANPPMPVAAAAACVKPRTLDDNEANTN